MMQSPKEYSEDKKNQLLSYLKELTTLEPGWDGYSGVPADNVSYLGSLFFLDKFLSFNESHHYALMFPQAMLSSDGEISLYWERANDYLEVILPEDNQYYYFYDSLNDSCGEDDLRIDAGLSEMMKSRILAHFKLMDEPS
jgi:hypothetical protein